MRFRAGLIACLVCVAAFAGAQSQTTAQQAAQQTLGWLQQQWKRVEESGRPMAERVVREFPERFKDMKAQVSGVTKLATGFSDAHQLPQKQALLLELWRVRGSLNLLSLLSPDILHQLTGLDTKTLENMEAQVSAARTRLTKLGS